LILFLLALQTKDVRYLDIREGEDIDEASSPPG